MSSIAKRRIINLTLLVGVVVSLYFTAVYLLKELDMGNSIGMQIAFVGGVFLAIVLSTLFHELGHMLLGILSGFKITAFHFFGLTVTSKGISFRSSKNAWGYCSGILKKSSKPRLRFGLFIFGGLFGALCVAAFGFFCLFFLIDYPIVCALLGGGSAAAVACFLLDALPMTVDGVKTDGGYLLGLTTGNNSVKVAVNCLLIEGQMMNGVRISEIQPSLLFDAPVLRDDDVNSAVLHSHRYYYYLEKKDYENANRELSHIEDVFYGLPDMYQCAVAGDLVFNALAYLKDKDKAREFLPFASVVIENNVSIDAFRVKTAVELFLEENPTQAILTGKTGLTLAEQHPIRVIANLESEIIRDLIKQAALIEAEKHK